MSILTTAQAIIATQQAGKRAPALHGGAATAAVQLKKREDHIDVDKLLEG